MDFDDWVRNLREVLVEETGHIEFHEGRWKIEDRQDSLREFGERIFDAHLDTFKDCAVEVLREIDPQFDLEPDERYAATIHGKVLSHSQTLREGIANTVAILGTQGDALPNCSSQKPEATAVLVVRELFEEASWQLWGSVEQLLPQLAEAAPNEFLNAVERALNREQPPFDELFRQESNGTFGRLFVSGLLWALEGLAWSDEYLVRVATLLGELASRDPGGNWSNRPENSIISILLPWFPQTQATVDRRYACLTAIVDEYPDVAWRVLIKLLPSQHQTSSGTHKPSWFMDISKDWKPTVTNLEYQEQVTHYAELAFELAKEDLSRLKELMGLLDNLPPHVFDAVLGYLSSDEVTTLDEDQRLPIWEKLTAFSHKHQRFQDADWALPLDVVERLEVAANTLIPESPEALYGRLFSNRDFDLYEESGDWEAQRQLLDQKRQQAVAEIWERSGFDGVLSFVRIVKAPHQVGSGFAFVADEAAERDVLPGLLVDEEAVVTQFVGGFVWNRYRAKGLEWLDNLNQEEWGNEKKAKFLTFLPFDQEAWERVEAWLADYGELYWGEVSVNPYGVEGDLLYAVDKLLEVSRPIAAIECLYVRLHEKLPLDHGRTINAIMMALSPEEPQKSLDQHHVLELIKSLQENPDTDPDDLFRVEWAYLPLLDRYGGGEPILLQQRLANDPASFCEVVSLVYRPKGEEPRETVDEESEAIASNAWRLLHEWKRPPGMQDDGSFSAEAFLNWLEDVKARCRESGRFEVAMIKVGEVLLYCPEDPSGLWINQEVARVLNARDSSDMRSGFRTEVYNSRGVHWVDPTGQPERDLAEKWTARAIEVEQAGYARFGAILRELASSYIREAERVSAESG
ncbi:MAG: hypothetical protein RPV21_01625 [Candidatus Sedimenticola sp. (ex Thyasira tokunagai)]